MSDAVEAKPLLDEVVDRYFGSADFNGWFFNAARKGSAREARRLVKAGLVEVISEAEYPNIRPWRTGRPVRDQLSELTRAAKGESYGVCLYPTEAALRNRIDPLLHVNQPYRRRLAEGRGNLEVAFFQFDVLEVYRNDPRFSFEFSDFGAQAGATEAVYTSETEPDEDKTSISYVGFAYESSTAEKDPIVRRLCAFLIDLARLTPIHQQRWRTYEVPAAPSLRPHPVWLAEMMGHWADGIGPFERFMFELQAWNELHRRAFGVDLLRHLERPREFGWVLRPSSINLIDYSLKLFH